VSPTPTARGQIQLSIATSQDFGGCNAEWLSPSAGDAQDVV
jgi:hypothetical protein